MIKKSNKHLSCFSSTCKMRNCNKKVGNPEKQLSFAGVVLFAEPNIFGISNKSQGVSCQKTMFAHFVRGFA